jgi:alanine racemase
MSGPPDLAAGWRTRPTRAEIDLGAFSRNIDAIVARLPNGSRLIAVLKANAYGHGAIELARHCKPDRVAMIGVALLEEALELRHAGITLPILVFGSMNAIDVALDNGITPGVTGPEELAIACEVARHRDVGIHLKLDSGMGRMGVVESELPHVIELIRNTPRLRIDGIYTHLANADEPADSFTATQIANFDRMVAALRAAGVSAPLHHIANSAATMRGLVRPGDYARVGIALYGVAQALLPVPGGQTGVSVLHPVVPGGQTGVSVLHPVMRWRTEIVRLKTLPRGAAIGYGTTFHTSRESRIATLPVGYADGYRRAFSNNAEVLIRGKRAPVVGRVSMDLVTIDVTGVDAAMGDEVVLLGDSISAGELAAKANTISYEIFCGVTTRVPRHYLAS